jgi:hypothetical protein
MAIIFTEGFDAYGSSNGSALDGYARKWPSASIGTFDIAAGRFGGKAVHFSSSFTRWIQTPAFAIGTITLGASIKFTAFPGMGDGTQVFLALFDSSANQGISVALTPAGELAVYLGGSQLAVTTGLALAVNTWHTVELGVVVGNSGSYDLHVNGSSVLSASADTQPGSSSLVDVVRIGKNANSSMLPMFDDFYVRDDSTFMGPTKIVTIFPDGDAAVDCTPSTGSDNHALVDDNPANSDTDYVTGSAGDGDLYDYQGLTDVSQVYAVAVNTVCRQTDASPLDVKLVAKSGSTTDASAAQTVGSTSYVQKAAIWENNPDTAAPWTPSEINAAQFGFEIE